jgi:hypothetical protein
MIPALSEGPLRDLRSENFGTDPKEASVDLCTFSTTKRLPRSGDSKRAVHKCATTRLLFDMGSLVAAQRLAQIDQFERCGSPPRREPGDCFARCGAGFAAPGARHSRRAPPVQRERHRGIRRDSARRAGRRASHYNGRGGEASGCQPADSQSRCTQRATQAHHHDARRPSTVRQRRAQRGAPLRGQRLMGFECIQ